MRRGDFCVNLRRGINAKHRAMSQQETTDEQAQPETYPDISQVYTLDKRKGEFIKALCQTLGNITKACVLAKVSRKTHYNWLEADAVYAEAFAEIMQMQLDIAEETLLHAAKLGQPSLLIFYLKNKGNSRGYYPDAWHVAQSMLGRDVAELMKAPDVTFVAAPPKEDLPNSQ